MSLSSKIIHSAFVDANTVQGIVKAAIEKETGMIVAKISLDVGMADQGYGATESKVPVFRGINMVFA